MNLNFISFIHYLILQRKECPFYKITGSLKYIVKSFFSNDYFFSMLLNCVYMGIIIISNK